MFDITIMYTQIPRTSPPAHMLLRLMFHVQIHFASRIPPRPLRLNGFVIVVIVGVLVEILFSNFKFQSLQIQFGHFQVTNLKFELQIRTCKLQIPYFSNLYSQMGELQDSKFQLSSSWAHNYNFKLRNFKFQSPKSKLQH